MLIVIIIIIVLVIIHFLTPQNYPINNKQYNINYLYVIEDSTATKGYSVQCIKHSTLINTTGDLITQQSIINNDNDKENKNNNNNNNIVYNTYESYQIKILSFIFIF
eukprot:UN10831